MRVTTIIGADVGSEAKLVGKGDYERKRSQRKEKI